MESVEWAQVMEILTVVARGPQTRRVRLEVKRVYKELWDWPSRLTTFADLNTNIGDKVSTM